MDYPPLKIFIHTSRSEGWWRATRNDGKGEELLFGREKRNPIWQVSEKFVRRKRRKRECGTVEGKVASSYHNVTGSWHRKREYCLNWSQRLAPRETTFGGGWSITSRSPGDLEKLPGEKRRNLRMKRILNCAFKTGAGGSTKRR